MGGENENVVPSQFIDEYKKFADPLRDLETEDKFADPESMILPKDLF